jgi:hypothetical protein
VLGYVLHDIIGNVRSFGIDGKIRIPIIASSLIAGFIQEKAWKGKPPEFLIVFCLEA